MIRKKHIIALLLSGLVCPGAGQFYLKRKWRGAVISIAVAGLVFYPLFRYLTDVKSAMLSNAEVGGDIAATVNIMMNAWQKEQHVIFICTVGIVICWAAGIVDILFFKGDKDAPMQ